MKTNLLTSLLMGIILSNSLNHSNANNDIKSLFENKINSMSITIEEFTSNLNLYLSNHNNINDVNSDATIESEINDMIQKINIENIKKIPNEIFKKLSEKDK